MEKQRVLYLLCGVPASGKSHWSEKVLKNNEPNSTHWISRDNIRFSLLKKGEKYFSHEKDVYKIFVETINASIHQYDYTIADATHLNSISRYKLLSKLNLNNVKVIPVNFICNLDDLIKRNSKREGLAKVPKKVIKEMYSNFEPANFNEDFKYFEIINYKE